MRCSGCGGPYSESTGHIWTEQIRLCGACAKDWKDWLKAHTKRRWGKLRFYDYTETSRNKTRA